MTRQGRSQSGRFTPKSDEPRSVRTMRLTNVAWVKLGEVAEARNMTRADLIEELSRKLLLEEASQPATFGSHTNNIGEVSLTKVRSAIDQVLNDPSVTRHGKDRGSVKRAVQALMALLIP